MAARIREHRAEYRAGNSSEAARCEVRGVQPKGELWLRSGLGDPRNRLLASRAGICQYWPVMSAGETGESKALFWIGSSRDDLRRFPEQVSHAMGFALWQAQLGRKHRDAKVLKGFGGAGVLEVVEDHDGNTYRAVYTVMFAGAVYVLHAFQKKSKKGIKTPVAVMNLIRQRLKAAEEHDEERRAQEERCQGGPH